MGNSHPPVFPRQTADLFPQHSTLTFYCRQNTATSRAWVNPEVFKRARYGSSLQSIKSWCRKGKARQNKTNEPAGLKSKLKMRRRYIILSLKKCYSKNIKWKWYLVFCKDSFYRSTHKTLAQLPFPCSRCGFHSVSSKIFCYLNKIG